MPKPRFNNKPSWKNQYQEHDFRGVSGGGGGGGGGGGFVTRHVKFKTNRHGKKDNKDWASSVRQHLQDEDYDMGGGATASGSGRVYHKSSFKSNRNRSDSPAPNFQHKRKLLDGPMGWFKITLPHGNKYEKDFILKTLLDKIQPLPLWPIVWRTNGTMASFFVDEFKVAEKLHELDRQIQMPDGFRMIIKVNGAMPNVDVNAEMKEKIKMTMAKRYNAPTKALDLTKFHADPDLQDCFCALFKPIVFLTVVEIIVENIPELEAINLHDNKISHLTYLKNVNTKLPNLKILHMGNNKFRDISMLDPLIGLPIVDLVLNGNPLCLKFKDQEMYIGSTTTTEGILLTPSGLDFFCSEVRKRFPKVMKLDGVDLPPPIRFDLAEDIPLPPSCRKYLCNPEGELIVGQFLDQYFAIFDSDNRQSLIDAYHESAVYSMTMTYPYGQKDKSVNWLSWYTAENRNILRVTDPTRRNKLLKQGKVSIVSFLQEMPFTKHDIHSFTVDLVLFTAQMICVTVTGMFKELKSGHKVPPIRYFFRTLAIVPAGSGFCIINESYHITNATDEQAKNAFKIQVPIAQSIPPVATPPQPSVSSPVAVAAVGIPGPEPNDLTKQQMVRAMSEQSGMNLPWSEKCLVQNGWDFQRSVAVFADLQKQGIIPSEAFVK